jgi:hypothetical protein
MAVIIGWIAGDEQEALLKELLFQVKAALKRDDIHDANRTMLSLLVEGLLEKLDANSKVKILCWT